MITKILFALLLVGSALAGTGGTGGGSWTHVSMPTALINANKPMIVLDYYWWDDAGILTNTDLNYTTTLTQISTCGSHAITSGYSGAITVYTKAGYIFGSFNNQNATDTNVTTIYMASCQAGNNTIVTHDDDVMWGLYSAADYTDDGWALFKNAINWAWDTWYSNNV